MDKTFPNNLARLRGGGPAAKESRPDMNPITGNELLNKVGAGLIAAGALLHLKGFSVDALHLAHRNDFGHLYTAAYMAPMGLNFFDPELLLKTAGRIGVPRVNPFVYPPFFALLLIPLRWFAYNGAWMVFTAASYAALLLSLRTLIGIFKRPGEPARLWWGAALTFTAFYDPLARNFAAGQVNTFLLLILCLAWKWILENKPVRAGAILGLGAAFKVTPGFFVLYLVWKRRWRAAGALVFVVLASMGVSLAVLGIEPHLSFLNETRQMAYGSSTWEQFGQHYHVEPHNQAPAALWHRLLTVNPSTNGIADAPGVANTLCYLTAFAVVAALVFKSPPSSPPGAVEFALWTIGPLWLPSLLWDHYFVQMLFALAVAARIALNGGTAALPWAIAGTALLCAPYFYDFPPFKEGLATLAMSVRLYGSAMVFAYLWANMDRAGDTAAAGRR